MIIDAHAHWVPPSLVAAIREEAGAFPSLRLIPQGEAFGLSFAGSRATRPVSEALSDLGARERWMDEQGIDLQVVGGWLDIFGYELPVAEGIRWARLANTHMMATARVHPRFLPLATVPLQDGERAAEMLHEAHDQGFKGVMIGTQPKGTGGVLDDPSLDPFWRSADALETLVFIHPVFESGDHRLHDYGMANAVGRITDTLIAVSRLIYGGHVLRYGRARIVVGVGGAALPYVLGRLRRNRMLDASLADPDASLQRLYCDTIVQDPRALRLLAEVVGADRILLGSDMPFPIGDPEPMRVVAEAGFPAAVAASIHGGLAASLFGCGVDR